MDKLLEMYLDYPKNNMLHTSILIILKNLLSHLFSNIDKTSSEYELASFFDFILNIFYKKVKDKINEGSNNTLLFKGHFDDLCFYI